MAANVPFIINGKEVQTQDTYEISNPKTGQPLHKSSNATTKEAVAAVTAAQDAFESWSQTTPGARRDIFLKAAALMDSRAKELSEYIMTETGGDEGWAGFNVMLGKECLLACAGRVSTIEGRIPALSDPTVGGLIVKEAYGAVFAMAPWSVTLNMHSSNRDVANSEIGMRHTL